jgi:polyhydroxybutyrate depolymerase
MPNKMKGYLYSSDQKRTYLLYVPKSYRPEAPTPLILSFHGYAEWPAHQMEISHWNQCADVNGFIVVYPSGAGSPRRWKTNGQARSVNGSKSDVVFISDLIDKLAQQYNIDPARVYANGLSNGGGMSLLLACKLADRIAAIGSVSGAYLYPLEACKSARPVPLIAFHGTGDPVVPYYGGRSFFFNYPFPVIPDWIKCYAIHNQCEAEPVSLPAIGEVSGISYSGCNQNAEVVFYTIQGGGHTWPGGGAMPEFIVGRTTHAIDATQMIWEFFVRHPLSSPIGSR